MNHVNDFYYDPKYLSKSEVKLINEKIEEIATLSPQINVEDDNLMLFEEWCYDNKVSNKDIEIFLKELKHSKNSILKYDNKLANSIILSYYGDVVVIVDDGINTFIITL